MGQFHPATPQRQKQSVERYTTVRPTRGPVEALRPQAAGRSEVERTHLDLRPEGTEIDSPFGRQAAIVALRSAAR